MNKFRVILQLVGGCQSYKVVIMIPQQSSVFVSLATGYFQIGFPGESRWCLIQLVCQGQVKGALSTTSDFTVFVICCLYMFPRVFPAKVRDNEGSSTWSVYVSCLAGS